MRFWALREGLNPALLGLIWGSPGPARGANIYNLEPSQSLGHEPGNPALWPCFVGGDRWVISLAFGSYSKYVFLIPAGTPGIPQIGRKWEPRAPQISSECLRKSLDFEIGVGDRLGTLRVSRLKTF